MISTRGLHGSLMGCNGLAPLPSQLYRQLPSQQRAFVTSLATQSWTSSRHQTQSPLENSSPRTQLILRSSHRNASTQPPKPSSTSSKPPPSTNKPPSSSSTQKPTIRLTPTDLTSPTAPSTPAPSNTTINPPPSTLPAPLEVPDRKPDQSLFGYYYACGRAYLTFYKTGIKNIWGNYKLSRGVWEKLQGSSTSSSTSSPQTHGGSGTQQAGRKARWVTGRSAVLDAALLGHITRGDLQLLRRNRHDIVRVPPFVLLFAVFGEWLPLIVVFFTKLVPGTCRIPGQVRGEREKAEKRRTLAFRNLGAGVDVEVVRQGEGEGQGKGEGVEVKADRRQLVLVGRSTSVIPAYWDRLEGVGLPPTGLVRKWVMDHVLYLCADDELVRKGNGAKELGGEEVRIACMERGIDVLGRKDEEVRKTLQDWLDGTKGEDIGDAVQQVFRRLLRRPNVWSDIQK